MLKKNVDIFYPCLHCVIAQVIHARDGHGLPDDVNNILIRLCESIAEICANPDAQNDRIELLTFSASLLAAMFHDVKTMNWKTDNAGPNKSHH